MFSASGQKFQNFDQVYNNFIASYFAGALIIPKKSLMESLKELFAQEKWNPLQLHKIIKSFKRLFFVYKKHVL